MSEGTSFVIIAVVFLLCLTTCSVADKITDAQKCECAQASQP